MSEKSDKLRAMLEKEKERRIKLNNRIVKILNALNISADELLCDLVPSASHVTDDEISKRLEGLTPMQKKVALDLLDTYITNLPYLTKEE